MPGLTEIYKSKLRGILIESPVTFTREDAIMSALKKSIKEEKINKRRKNQYRTRRCTKRKF
jgi:hypothetical protein